MALPPLTAAPPAPAADDMALPAGGDNGIGGDDTGADQPMVFATIMKLPDGKFLLVDGDEPEPGEMGDGESGMMDKAGVDGPALLKQLMAKIEGSDGAQEGMEQGFSDDSDDMPEKPPMKPPMKRMAA